MQHYPVVIVETKESTLRQNISKPNPSGFCAYKPNDTSSTASSQRQIKNWNVKSRKET